MAGCHVFKPLTFQHSMYMLPGISRLHSAQSKYRYLPSNFTSLIFHHPLPLSMQHSVYLQPIWLQHSRQLMSSSQCSITSYPSIQMLIQDSHLRRNMSTTKHQDEAVSFKDADICLVFDDADALISQSTFKEAKSLASKQKSRLVYMSKNADGMSCFKLQPLPGIDEKDNILSKLNLDVGGDKKKPKKGNEKEIKMKTNITDHDMSIKLKKIRDFLEKDKVVLVHIMTSRKATQNPRSAAALEKCLRKELEDVCKIRQTSSNERSTLLTLTPTPKEQPS